MARRILPIWLVLLQAINAFAKLPAHNAADLRFSHWEGYFEIRSYYHIGFHVDFAPNPKDEEFGSIYNPRWGQTTFPITRLKVEGNQIEFEFGPDPANPGTFSGTFTDNAIRGTYRFAGKAYPFMLGPSGRFECKIKPVPQIPLAPFPYRQERITFAQGDVKLSGILTHPPKQRRHPAAVLIPGSGGDHTADPGIPGKPNPQLWMFVLADHLTRAGLATLRLDSRGAGNSTGSYDASTIDDLAADAAAGVDFLRRRQDIDRRFIGLVGMSEGGDVAPLAASKTRSSFVVILGGSGVPLGDLRLNGQSKLDSLLEPNEAQRLRMREFNERLYELCKRADLTADDIKREMTKFRRPVEKYSLEGIYEDVLQSIVPQMTTSMMRSQFRHDPAVVLRSLWRPILVMSGEKDLQVPADSNIPAIERALKEAGNSSATFKIWPGLSHSFTKSSDGLDSLNNDVIDPQVLEFMTDWIGKQASR